MTMTRNDIHRPSAPEFDPENYDLFGVFDLNPEWGDSGNRIQVVNALLDQGWSFSGAPYGSGRCSHCGAYIRYAALMGHTPTHTLLYVGETCLDNRFDLTKGEFQELRKAAALNRERSALKDKRDAFLAAHPDMVWLSYSDNLAAAGGEIEWTTFDYDETYATREEAEAATAGDPHNRPVMIHKRGTTFHERARLGDKFYTLSDMWYRFSKYGEMSDAQVAYATKILGWITDAAVRLDEREAASRAAVAAGVTVPTGRVVVEGEVVSTKWVENAYGGTEKMLVANEAGWKVWGSVPSAIDVEKGTRVRFTATVEASNDDALFGFYKRPSKAEILG